MTQHDDRLQESVDGLTAIEHTKRGYGLWRGEVIHPADARMDAIIASGDPITDTKGLGLRYVAVRGRSVIPHFRVNDPDKFSAALDRAFPAVHDAIVRVVAEDIRTGGYDALARWCEGPALPEAFRVADVAVEKPCCEGGVSYRPDIVVAHGEGGRIELEVVNTHAPEGPRAEAAWAAGHIVLTMRVRDLVEQIVFSEGRDVVPDAAALREMLRGRRFRLAGRERVSADVLAIWRDLNLSAYAMELRARLRAGYREDYIGVVEIVEDILAGCASSDIDYRRGNERALRDVYDRFHVLQWAANDKIENVFPPRVKDPRDSKHRWSIAAREFRERLQAVTAPHPALLRTDAAANAFLDQFDRAHEPVGARRLRYTVAAVWHCRKRRLQAAADEASMYVGFGNPKNGKHRRHPLMATEEGIS